MARGNRVHSLRGHPGLAYVARHQERVAERETIEFAQKAMGYRKPCEPAKVAIRGWKPEDLNFIIDSWASSYRYSPDVAHTDKEVYKVEQRSRIYRLIPRSRIIVANKEGYPDEILGWICFEPPKARGQLPILHYVLVQRSVQLQGIGAALVELCRKTAFEADSPIWATHYTSPMRHIKDKWHVMHNDFLLEQDKQPQTGSSYASYGI